MTFMPPVLSRTIEQVSRILSVPWSSDIALTSSCGDRYPMPQPRTVVSHSVLCVMESGRCLSCAAWHRKSPRSVARPRMRTAEALVSPELLDLLAA